MINPPPRKVDVLKKFYTDAGIDLVQAKQEARTAETTQHHRLEASVSPAKMGAAKKSYGELLETFGESFDLKVGEKNNDDQWPVLYIDVERGVVKTTDFDSILKRTSDLNLEVKIHKRALIEKLEIDDESSYTCFYYLFEDNLLGFLNAPVLELDELLFPEPSDKPVLIVLSETEVLFAGEMLTIVDEITLRANPGLKTTLQAQRQGKTEEKGTSAVAKDVQVNSKTARDYVRSALHFFFGKKAATPKQAHPSSVPLSGTLQEEIQQYRTAAIETPSLFGGKFEHLTPLHFLGQWRIKHSHLEKILAIHFLNICILYTANRSTFDDDKQALTSVYASADRTTTLSLKEAPTGEIPVSALADLAKWLYGGKGTDRRNIFQNIVARGLANDDPKINYPSFAARAPQLLKDAIWQHQVFVDGKITKHFDELQKVIGYVADINKKISEAIDSVTKSLTDALLATIGVLVLTVLAALVKKDTSIQIFSLSMKFYAWYVFIYAALRMGSIGHSYWLLSREANVQVSEYQTALQIEKITDLSSSLRKRQWQFQFWFWFTVALYLVLGGFIWWAGKNGPQLLIDQGIIAAPTAKVG